MKIAFAFITSCLLFACSPSEQSNEQPEENTMPNKKEWALVIHGGAGTILKKNMTPERERLFLDKLTEVLQKGEEILSNGGTSLDAVEQCIQIMEESELFNAGKGSVFTNAETNEMDASIMNGADLNAGAVAGVGVIKSPISAARLVMEKSPHVMLIGKGAEQFAEENGEEMVDPSYFFTQKRFDALQKVKAAQETGAEPDPDDKHGTVGVVALDKQGNLAAGTSTGGMTNKRWGRVGDSPIIGAGTYANNQTCGVSATGHGEFFIRVNVAYAISALMEYKGMPVNEACEEIVMRKLVDIGGDGGVIALDKHGNHSMTFNSKGMYRGFCNSDGETEVAIYK